MGRGVFEISRFEIETNYYQDFDGGMVGQQVAQSLGSNRGPSKVTWSVIPASQVAGGLDELAILVREERTWVAVASFVFSFSFSSHRLKPPASSFWSEREAEHRTNHTEFYLRWLRSDHRIRRRGA